MGDTSEQDAARAAYEQAGLEAVELVRTQFPRLYLEALVEASEHQRADRPLAPAPADGPDRTVVAELERLAAADADVACWLTLRARTWASPRVLLNQARCHGCGEVVTSTHRHDFRSCGCGNVAVDGGREYLRRCYNGEGPGFEELSQHETVAQVRARLTEAESAAESRAADANVTT